MRDRIALPVVLTASLAYSGLTPAAPVGGQVTAGTGTVSQTGNTTTIRQTSADLFLNWQSFNVAANEVVNFVQPNASSIAVNRILGNTGSRILGQLDANGQVWLINPNGILFGKGAQVNVGGLTASTLDVSDASFSMNLRSFGGAGTGAVVNQGTIQAADGGYVALLGNQVSNQGVIRAQLGTVALGAGSAETLTFSGRQLIHLRVDQSTLNNLAANGQLIQADGGRVIMTAGAQDSLLASVVNNTGVVEARSVVSHAGSIVLLAGMAAGQVHVGGTLDATAEAGASGGSIETSGAAVSVASAAKIVAGPGGSWRIDPVDLTIDTAAATAIDTSLNAGTNVTETTTATTASGSGNQSAGLGDINVDAPIAWSNPAARLTLSAYHAINVNAAVNGAGAVVMQAAGGNLTLAAGTSIEGDAGVTLGTAANFVNLAGANALSAGSAGTWQVYSTNPTLDTPGGLNPAFVQYAAAFQATPAQSGNGFLYSVAPSISVTALAGTASKTYDGGTSALLTAANANYTVSGALNGDTVNAMSATYQTADVGSAIPVTSPATAAGLVITSAAGKPVYGYALAGSPVTASIGTIAQAQLTAAIVGDSGNADLSKVYDGTTTATLNSGNYQLSGFVAGQSATVNQPSSVAYVAAGAGPETLNATFAVTNFVAGSGTKLSNYLLPTTATGSGTVLQAPLVITGVLASGKVYDAGTSDALNTANAGLYGVIGGDSVSLSTAGATGTFASANVGNNLSVATGGFALSGAQQADYQLIAPANLTASITPAPLSITGVSAANKVYNGSTTAVLVYNNPRLSGLLGADAATVTLSVAGATATFASKNVGTGLPVAPVGFTIGGTDASDYALTSVTGLAANITPAPLTVSLVGNPTKPYNGTTTAALSAANFTVTGFVGGEGATIPQTTLAEYATPNAGSQTVTATLAVPDFATTGGALLSNYTVPTTVTGTGLITPAPLSGAIIGNPSKVFDGGTSATLTSANYVLTGFLTGQGATVNQTSGVYASANAGLEAVSATLVSGNYTGTGATLLANYSLPTTLTGTGTITPAALVGTIYAGITGNPSKPYDGTTVATLGPGNFVLTGFMGSDGATVTQTVGQYSSANAGLQAVSAVLTNPNFTANSGTILANYTLPTSAYGSGTITPVTLSVTIGGDPTRVYNGSTSTVLLSGNYSITGFVTGEGAVINPSALINYGSANVGSQSISAVLTPSAYTANSGTQLSNYVLASSAAGTGNITAAPVYITGVYATNKVYDTTSVDPLNTGSQALSGVVSGDAGNVSLTGVAAGAFATTQAGTALPVSVSGLSIAGTAASNYTLQTITGLAATITPAPLTLTGVSAISKPYDGTSVATLNTAPAVLVGVYSGDTVGFSTAGVSSAFTSVNVGSNLKVNTGGFTLAGAQSSDYALAQPTGLSAAITQATITAQITGNPTKVYDGSASTTLTAGNYTLVGFATVGGVTQGASVPQSATASYVAPDAGVGVAIGSTLVLSDFVANAGTNLSNYALPVVGTGTGTITPAPLAATLVGTPTKTYDGTTAATLTPGNYLLSGFVGSQSASVTQTAGTYASANAGSRSVTAALTSADYSPGTNTTLGNYLLPVSATGTGTINRAPLTIVGVATTPQTYNGTTVDVLTGATLTGTTYAGDAPVLTNTSVGTLGSSGNAGTDAVTTAMGLSGAGSGNYSIAQPSGLTAVISPAPLSATSSVSKTYDGTANANLSGSHTTFVGFIGSDGATVNAGVTGSFAAANVGSGLAITGAALSAGNLTASGATLLSNYSLPSSDNGSGNITPATLTYTAATASVQYGLTPALLTGTVTGFVNNETLTTATLGVPVFSTAATSASNVGHYAIDGAGLTADNGNYQFVEAAGNATALTITRAPLQVTGVLTTSRAYNGSAVDALSGAVISGVIYNSDVLTLTNAAAGSLANNGNAGTDAVTTTMGLSGAAGGNYLLAQESGLSANISALALSATSTVTRSYTGTTTADLSGSNTVLSGFVMGQGATVKAGVTGTFANANVGGGIAITGAALSAANLTATGSTVLADYTLPGSDNGSGTITPAIVNLTGSRVYDGLLDANAGIFGSAGTVSGVNGENLILSGSGTLSSKNVVTGGTLASANGLSLLDGTGHASNYQLAGGTDSVTVTKLGITVTAAGVNKVYNDTLAATVSLASGGVLAGDSLSFADTGATFAGKNAANGVAIAVSGISASGTGVGNYTVNTTAATSANITPLGITVTAAGVNKVYDGTELATVTLASGGVLAGDSLSFADTSASFANKNVANGLGVAVSGISASGTGAGNYSVNNTAATSANITPLAITVTAAGINKVYDDTLAATVTFASGGVLAGDSLSFADTAATFAGKNVANGVAIAVSGISASGTGVGNYTINTTAATSANITPLGITVTAAGVNKVYDGTVAATVTLASGGVLAGDSLSFADTAASFANKNVANGLGVAVSGISATGTGRGNYTVNTTAATSANITPLAITVMAAGVNKVYDGTELATVTLASGGVLAGDSLSFADTAATFAGKNVANGVAIAVSGISASGTGAGNYTVNTTAAAGANITPASVNLLGSRVYDGLLDAPAGTFGSAGTVATGVGAETLVLSGSGTLVSKNAGTQALSALGSLTLGNGSGLASNYQLAGGTDTVTVTPLGITVTAVGVNKVYDDTLTATVTLASGGVLGGDSLSFSDTSASFADKNVANGLGIAVSGISASGTGVGNYTVNTTAATSANITPLGITVTAAGVNKVYDGTNVATVTLASGGVLAGDSLSFADTSANFADSNVANGLGVAVAGISASGAGAGNYTVNTAAATSANITPAIVNLAGSRVYDGLLDANASVFGSAGTVATGIGAETLVLSGTGTLVNRNAGTQGLSASGSLSLGNGSGLASNYQLAGGTDTVTVTPLGITVTATANDRTYDGTTTATLSAVGSTGILPGDSLTFSAGAATFADKNVGNAKPVAVTGISAVGPAAADYLYNTSALTTADITPATLTESAVPVSVTTGQVPKLTGSVSGFVPGDTLANATDGSLVWSTNASLAATPGNYAIDGSGLSAENYLLVQAPGNASALTITAAPLSTLSVYGSLGGVLDAAAVATPYGVGSANDYGNNTGNERRDTNPTDANRRLSDFSGRLALTILGAGVRMPADAAL